MYAVVFILTDGKPFYHLVKKTKQLGKKMRWKVRDSKGKYLVVRTHEEVKRSPNKR